MLETATGREATAKGNKMFDAYLTECADAYSTLCDVIHATRRDAPVDSQAASAWRSLAADSVERAAGVRLLLDVLEVEDPEPYPDAESMVEDIDAGCFRVSRANSEHPVWSVDENVAFRIVHDVLGHYAASVRLMGWDARARRQVAGFDWAGENAACAAHARLLTGAAQRQALFTECLAQTAYAIDRGGFGPQVVGDCGPHLPFSAAAKLHSRYAAWLSGDIS